MRLRKGTCRLIDVRFGDEWTSTSSLSLSCVRLKFEAEMSRAVKAVSGCTCSSDGTYFLVVRVRKLGRATRLCSGPRL